MSFAGKSETQSGFEGPSFDILKTKKIFSEPDGKDGRAAASQFMPFRRRGIESRSMYIFDRPLRVTRIDEIKLIKLKW